MNTGYTKKLACYAANLCFEDLPEDWVCPLCGLGKDVFVKEEA